MTKRKTIKKKIDRVKESNDWFDTHVEVMGFGRGTRNKKVKSIIKAQISRKNRLEFADAVIINDGSLEELHSTVMKFHQKFIAELK